MNDYIASIVHCDKCGLDWSAVYHPCSDSWLMEQVCEDGMGMTFYLAGGLACPNPGCTNEKTLTVKKGLVVQTAAGLWLDIEDDGPIFADVVRSN